MKPPPPIKPPEKLPFTHHLTIVPADGDERTRSVVLTEMQGDQVRRRKVIATEPNTDEALASLNRAAYRIYYFGEGAELMGD